MKKNTLKLGITFILAGYLSIGIAAGQGGRDLTDLSHLFWKSNINYVDGNCDKHQQYPMVEIPTYVSKDNQFLINASGTILVFDEYFPEEVREMELLIKCN